ncbi:MAG: efflux RND transporter periplasmic adaptor subunit [Betaproteobacteria bacterium]|nr:efflux RND transporter periplasmic adaptor subunit [Betaproteobacteria bacterium]
MNSPRFSHAPLAVLVAAALSACAPQKPAPEAARPVRTVELRFDNARDTNRYVGTVQARHEVDQAFRVGGKVASRKAEVGQAVREGDVLGVLDDTDYRLAEAAAREQLVAAQTQARQAESDRRRLQALKADGSVSAADEERATSEASKARAAAEAAAKQLELASNRLKYTVLRASRTGVVTQVRFEAGQVLGEGQPIVSIAAEAEPEIVVDVPEDQVTAFRAARFSAYLASAPEQGFEVVLRELSPQAAAQTRTYRARLKPVAGRRLPLGATATLVAERASSGGPSVAAIPATALTQLNGEPALWVVRGGAGEPAASVELVPVAVQGYRNDEVLVSGLPEGQLIVAAGVHKMAPGLRVALSDAARGEPVKQAAR